MDSVDVVLLTMNSERKLEECIASVYQNVQVAQLIAVDGGSTDQTLEILNQFNSKYGNVKSSTTKAQEQLRGRKASKTSKLTGSSSSTATWSFAGTGTKKP